MADQGCVNEGSDHRWDPWDITCKLQRLGSFCSQYRPALVIFELPLGVRIYFPAKQTRWFMLRLALLRYDWTAKEYIFFSAAGKFVDNVEKYEFPPKQN